MDSISVPSSWNEGVQSGFDHSIGNATVTMHATGTRADGGETALHTPRVDDDSDAAGHAGVYANNDQEMQVNAEHLLSKLYENMNVLDGLCGFSVSMRDNQYVLKWNNPHIDQSSRIGRIHQNLQPIFEFLRASTLSHDLSDIIYRMLVYMCMCCKIWDDDFLQCCEDQQIEEYFDTHIRDNFQKALDDIMILQYESLNDMMNRGVKAILDVASTSSELNNLLLLYLNQGDFNQERASCVIFLHKIVQQAGQVIYQVISMMNSCFFPSDEPIFFRRNALVGVLREYDANIKKMCVYLQSMGQQFSQECQSDSAGILEKQYQELQNGISNVFRLRCSLNTECQFFSIALKKYIENMNRPMECHNLSVVLKEYIEHVKMSEVIEEDRPAELVQQEMSVNSDAKIIPVDHVIPEESIAAPIGKMSNAKKITFSVLVSLCALAIITVSSLLAVMAVIHFAVFIVIGIAAVAICIMLLVKIVSDKKSPDEKPLVTGQDEINGGGVAPSNQNQPLLV